jgi:hypothetical protein
LACAAAYPIVAYGAASVPAPVVSLPAVDTNTPKLFDTTHESVGAALLGWHVPLHRKYPESHDAISHAPPALHPATASGNEHAAQLAAEQPFAGVSGRHDEPHSL